MTFLSAAQNAIAKAVGRRPPAVVSSTDEICVEMTALARDAAEDIAEAHDWQNLLEFYTINGDGMASAFPFPADYGRMVKSADVFDPNTWAWNYTHVPDYGQWLRMVEGGTQFITPGIWNIRKNQFQFWPVPGASEKATFPYISKNIWATNGGAPKATLDSDDDVFALDERLLTLALVWRWLSLKRMDYQQEIEDYNIALSNAMANDKGARIYRDNGRHRFTGTVPAWPRPLGPNLP